MGREQSHPGRPLDGSYVQVGRLGNLGAGLSGTGSGEAAQAMRPCHASSEGTRTLRSRYKHKRWRSSRIGVGPKSPLSCVSGTPKKWNLPKTVEDKLAEKKRELDKKRAYGATLQDQHTQMVEKCEQQVARMQKHGELVF